jgi:hypothetical protein
METPGEKILRRTTLGPEEWDEGQSIHRWSVILAGGEGKLPRRLTRAPFSTYDRIITVIGADHWKFLPRQHLCPY